MVFHVEPGALRAFGAGLGDATSGAEAADAYIKKYAEFGWHAHGLINHLQTAHEHFVNELTGGLAHLKELLEESKAGIEDAAAYYEGTDSTAAARVDGTYRETHRPSLRDRS